MSLVLRPVRVANVTDEEGMLVFEDERLVAVLTRLSNEHAGLSDYWFLEVGFGYLEGPDHPTFSSLEESEVWIARRLLGKRRVAGT